MNYKEGDIVVVRSSAGTVIPLIHVRLLKRIVVLASMGNSMDWPGYSGWEATPVYQNEIDILKKQWNIPFTEPEKDLTFVYERDIVRKRKRE
tara:strand:+ start:1427 stop:1702 length:276 start_codon:yes stop_codon:yes gene_type:complete